MAGVAGPMLGRSKAQGARFLTGLLIGGLTASSFVAALVYLLGTLASMLMPRSVREVVTAVVVLALGVADMLNRTPHVWRQVPQAFVRSMRPGRLGLVWGFDLALLVTTQKSTSLTWATLAAVSLLFPTDSGLVLLSMTAIGVLAIVLRSVTWTMRPLPVAGDRGRPWFPVMRRAVGVSMLGLGVFTVVGAWSS
jgi:hypothetical protein